MIFATTWNYLDKYTGIGTVRDADDNVLALNGNLLEMADKLRKRHFKEHRELFELNAHKELQHRMFIEVGKQTKLVFETTVVGGVFDTFA